CEQSTAGIDHRQALAYVYHGLMALISTGRISPLVIEKANGNSIFDSALANQLRALGAGISPRGIRLAAKPVSPRVPSTPDTESAPGTFGWETDADTNADIDMPSPRRGRSITEALDQLSFDDPPAEEQQRRSGPMRPP